MTENRRKVQLHKKGDQSDQWIPLTVGSCVHLTDYKNDPNVTGAITNAVDAVNENEYDDLNTALMKLENRPDFVGATSSEDGERGLVPAPLKADAEKFLKGDGTWSTVEGSEIGDGEVTITVNGTPYVFTMNQSANLQIDINIPQNPVIFQGTVDRTGINGTSTPLPAAGATNNGHEYKVTEDGTYQGVSAKVGDTLISNGVAWVKIPSGDEPSGTVLSVAAGTGLQTNLTNGAPITESGELSLVSVNLSGATVGNNTNTTPQFGDTFVIPKFTYDEYGRVTTVSDVTMTLPSAQSYSLAPATTSTLGGVIISTGLSVQSDGTLTVNAASNGTLGGVKLGYVRQSGVAADERKYAVEVDGNGKAYVDVPWVEYTNASAASGDTTLSLVTTGDKYVWNNKPDIGSGATDAAAGNHTHAVSIGTDSGATVGINLAFGSQYKITAGGESFVFTTPQAPSAYGSGTGINIDSNNNINVKLGYTTSGNNRAVEADSNGNLYVTQTDTTYSDYTPATSTNGVAGLVPAPTTSDKAKFLNGGSGWVALAIDETKTVSSGLSSFAVTYGHNYFVGGADVTAISSGSNNAVNTLTITGVNGTDNPTGADFEANIFFKAGSSFTKPTFSNNTPMLIGDLPTFEADGIYLMSLYKGTVIFGTLSSYTNA